MSSTKMKRFFSSVGVNLLVVLALLFILTPVIWLFLTSIKTRSEMFQTPITLFPKTFDFGNYVKIWEKIQFGTFIKNSLIMSLYNTVVTLAIASMAAYSLSRYTFKGKDFFSPLFAGLPDVSRGVGPYPPFPDGKTDRAFRNLYRAGDMLPDNNNPVLYLGVEKLFR